MSDQGIYAKIPIAELSVAEARNIVEDPSYWDETLPAVLFHYQITAADYETLTVYQHRLLVDYLTARGLHGDA